MAAMARMLGSLWLSLGKGCLPFVPSFHLPFQRKCSGLGILLTPSYHAKKLSVEFTAILIFSYMMWNILIFVTGMRIVIKCLRFESHGVFCCALVRSRVCSLTTFSSQGEGLRKLAATWDQRLPRWEQETIEDGHLLPLPSLYSTALVSPSMEEKEFC